MARLPKRVLAFLIALLLLPTQVLMAQQEPVVRVTTRLVVVNVVVKNKKGEAVTDLTREDFTLLDEGQPQSISLFSMETARSSAPPPPLPENTFTNRIEQASAGLKSVTVILVDNLNTEWEDRRFARDHIVKFLGQLQPDDRVALYVLGKELRILQNFTTDARPLLRALDRTRSADQAHVDASTPEVSNTGDPEDDAYFNDLNQALADFYVQDRARRTANAMVAIANYLAPFPGRKNLIWVSSSFPISIGMDEIVLGSTRNRQAFTKDLERASRALSNANIAIYPVDARGMVVAMRDASQGKLVQRGVVPRGIIQTADLGRTHDTMIALAEGTGGRAFYNSNDIQTGIRRAIDDAEVTYILGYYPSHAKWDGKFRKIRVNVKRDDLRLRHRSGYFTVLPDEQPNSAEGRTLALREEVLRPLRSSAVGLTVQVNPVRTSGVTALRLNLRLDANHFTLEERNGRWVGALDLMFGQLHDEGKTYHQQTQTVNLNLTRASYEEATRDGLPLTKLLELLPDAQELVIVARDVQSGSAGSVSIPLGPYLQAPVTASQPAPR